MAQKNELFEVNGYEFFKKIIQNEKAYISRKNKSKKIINMKRMSSLPKKVAALQKKLKRMSSMPGN